MNKIGGGGMIFVAVGMVLVGLILQLEIIDFMGILLMIAGGIIVVTGIVRMVTGGNRV